MNQHLALIYFGLIRSEERRVGKDVRPGVDLGGRRIIKKKTKSKKDKTSQTTPTTLST